MEDLAGPISVAFTDVVADDGAPAAEFMALLAPHLPFLRRFALHLTRNRHDGEDLVQDVLIKLLARPEGLAFVAALQPWLARVMYRQHIDHCRRGRPAHVVSLDPAADGALAVALVDDGPDPEADCHVSSLSRRMSRAIEQLPPDLREIVQLHDLQELSLPVLAVRLQVPLDTLKSRVKRARFLLRVALGVAVDQRATPCAANDAPAVPAARSARSRAADGPRLAAGGSPQAQ